jgi:hypothetical protein
MEKYGTARQATNDNIIRVMPFLCWVKMVTYTLLDLAVRWFPRQKSLRERVCLYVVRYIPNIIYIVK